MRMVFPYRRGLTLLECLLSIVIVAVLAAFSLGGWRLVGRSKNEVRVRHHLRLMAHALNAYVADYGGRLPAGAMGVPLQAGGLQGQNGPACVFWYNALDFYMGGRDHTLEGMLSVERPRWQTDPAKVYPEDAPKTLNGYGSAVGFGWNHQHFGLDSQPANVTLGWGSRMMDVEKPTRTIIIGTGEDSINATNVGRNMLVYANSIRCRRYRDGGYYLFLDGHIEHLRPEEVMANNSELMRKRN